MSSKNAWITLATNDGYAVGALVLAHSLRAVGTRANIHVVYTEGVSTPLRYALNFLIKFMLFQTTTSSRIR
jgi:hypothetical protein